MHIEKERKTKSKKSKTSIRAQIKARTYFEKHNIVKKRENFHLPLKSNKRFREKDITAELGYSPTVKMPQPAPSTTAQVFYGSYARTGFQTTKTASAEALQTKARKSSKKRKRKCLSRIGSPSARATFQQTSHVARVQPKTLRRQLEACSSRVCSR